MRPQSLTIPIPATNFLVDAYRDTDAVNQYAKPIKVAPQVYLYGEPDLATIEKFDVVINVAKEVQNPFEKAPRLPDSPRHARSRTELLRKSAVVAYGSGPIISNLYTLNKNLEYIWVPWDHTTQMVLDLDPLTAIMADRVCAGKSILVHCQCGVSRSASLVVAYVMRESVLDFTSAYRYVKQLSPTISPNISLMTQLMDWQELRPKKLGSEQTSDMITLP